VQAVIEAVGGVEGELLRLMYLDGLSMAAIADKLTYCERHTNRLYRKALGMVADILEANGNTAPVLTENAE
jgi:DNA-directed RNA polymerase specialized sigma24 family protein